MNRSLTPSIYSNSKYSQGSVVEGYIFDFLNSAIRWRHAKIKCLLGSIRPVLVFAFLSRNFPSCCFPPRYCRVCTSLNRRVESFHRALECGYSIDGKFRGIVSCYWSHGARTTTVSSRGLILRAAPLFHCSLRWCCRGNRGKLDWIFYR